MKKLYYLLAVAVTFSLLFLTVNAYSQSHPTKEWLDGLGAKACNFTIRYRFDLNTYQSSNRSSSLAKGYEVKILPGWLMIYPCRGSKPKIIAIPSERVIQIEVN